MKQNINHKNSIRKSTRNIKQYFREYCSRTSIHGIQYVGEETRNWTEKLWWVVIFIVSIAICTQLILKTYSKWKTRPVIVSLAEIPTSIWEIPFPAVTICPENKIRQTVFNYTEDLYFVLGNDIKDIPYDVFKKFQDASLVCEEKHIQFHENHTTDESTIDFIVKVAPQLHETMMLCSFKIHVPFCYSFFYPMLTEDGLCFTFNMLDSSELFQAGLQTKYYINHNMISNWSLDGGYREEFSMDAYPRRTSSSGAKHGLSLSIRLPDDDLDYQCRNEFEGYKILLHNPVEIPRVSEQYFRASLNQAVTVAVKPDMITTSENLKYYDPKERHCYFPDERHLKLFKIYTQRNCEVECRTNFTLANCGCVTYHMPHEKDTPICALGKIHCYEAPLKKIEKEQCNCLPACTSLSYNVETSQTKTNKDKNILYEKENTNTKYHWTVIDIFFKDTEFIPFRRSELYGLTDFVANCGGLLGLFMGFSMLSLVEILYFLTLRIWCNVKIYRRRKRQQSLCDDIQLQE